MRSLNSELQTRLNTGTTSLCHIITITRKDTTVLRFTDADQTVNFDGDDYTRNESLAVSAITSSANNGIQSTTVNVIFSNTALQEVDVARGLYDSATVKFSIVDYLRTDLGEIILLTGTMSTTTVTNKRTGQFEIAGLLSIGDMYIGSYFQATCRVDFGSPKCGKNIVDFTDTGTISDATNQGLPVTILSTDRVDGFYTFGVVTFTSGANSGVSMEVLNQYATDGTHDALYFALQLPYPIVNGDTFSIVAGCDKQPTTCLNKFNNMVNFRGEPFVPGQDALTDFLGSGTH